MRFSEYLDRSAAQYPDRLAFRDPDRDFTFQAARDHTHQVAHALTGALGFTPRTKIAVYSPNDALGYLAVLGLNRADMVWIPISYRNSVGTIVEQLDFFDVECLLYHSSFESNIAPMLAEVPSISSAVCIDAESDHYQSLAMLLEGCGTDFARTKEDPTAVALILATGGTTGPSKGVQSTHQNVETAMYMQMIAIEPARDPKYLVIAPVTHAAGLMIPALYANGATTIIQDGFDPKAVLDAIENERITHTYLPPTAIYALLDYPGVEDRDFSSLEFFICGSSPIAPQRLKDAVRVFGPSMTEWYGQSETLFPTLQKTSHDYLNADGSFREDVLKSTGKSNPLCWVEIMDDDGNILGPGEKGEIVVRGSSVMAGYYQNEAGTAEVSEFDWHHTTDMGFKDAEGFISIVDRKKDMIISGGFNVFPVEIEKVLNSHPAVRDCAVIGVPDPKWGEAVKAVVQLNDGADVEGSELLALCKERLGSLKTPKSVEFRDQLPLSPVGKVLKRAIREPYWADQLKSV